MYVDKITLENVRGFERLDFDLARPDGSHAGWTVFTGDNGSGKSALLKAIAIGLVGRDTGLQLQQSLRRWIRDGQHLASIRLEIVRTEADDAVIESGRSPVTKFPAKLVLRNGAKEPTLGVARPEGKPEKYKSPERTIWSRDAEGWFSCGYGPFRRVFGASPEATRLMVAPATARYVTMFQEAASLAEVNEWLRTLKHKGLENKAAEKEQLALLLEILGDDLMPNQIRIDRVDSDGLWLRDRRGVELSWHEMSDGYRAALALLADIVRHLVAVYGPKELTDRKDGKLFVKRSGVVLIDEVDAHLHPEWQREIGFWLKRHFPNIQFLVTSHSPLICQAADENGLFVLPEPGSDESPHALGDEDYRKVIASRPDTILLSPAFGLQNTRSPRAVAARSKYSQLKSKQQAGVELSDEESTLLQQLLPFARTGEEP